MRSHASPTMSAALGSLRNPGTGGSWLGRTLIGQTAGRSMIGQSKQPRDVSSSKESAIQPDTGSDATCSSTTITGPTNKMQKAPSSPHAKKHPFATIGASSLASKSPTRTAVAKQRHADHRQLEACYGKNSAMQSVLRSSPMCRKKSPASCDSSQSSSGHSGNRSTKGSTDMTRRRHSPGGSDNGQTHRVLQAALLSNDVLSSSGSCFAEKTGDQLKQEEPHVLQTLPLPATAFLQSGDFEAPQYSDQWDSASDDFEKCADQGALVSSCELLQQELSAINEVSVKNLEGDLTCRMLEAEVLNMSSWVDGLERKPSLTSLHHSEPDGEKPIPICEQLPADSQANGDSPRVSKRTAVQEVERLSQVIRSYESEVLPHLIIEKALLNCELTKAREAATTSEKDCEALRGRVLKAETESNVLRTELDAFRAATRGRRGGG